VSLLDIHVLGSPVLRAETRPLATVTEDVQRLIDDMFETMHACEGIGLAAPQVGRLERLAIVEVDERPLVLINPEIVTGEGVERAEEGCLSIPDVFGEVERSARVTLRAMDRHGQPFELDAAGLLARAIQHEIDHLHGKLFIDYLSFLKKRGALAKWDSLREQYPQMLRKVTAQDAQRAAASGQVEEEVL
jgi:peptide deformylase